jgi:hypothetical protein
MMVPSWEYAFRPGAGAAAAFAAPDVTNLSVTDYYASYSF